MKYYNDSIIIRASYDKNKILTVYYKDGFSRYKGECTVWHHYPSMKRCSTETESMLCDIWEYIREHGNDYPDAHLKK